MVAVVAEQIVPSTLEYPRSVVDYFGDFFLGQHGKAVDYLAAKGSTWRFEFWFCPVDSADAFAIVAAVCIFSFVDNHARM